MKHFKPACSLSALILVTCAFWVTLNLSSHLRGVYAQTSKSSATSEDGNDASKSVAASPLYGGAKHPFFLDVLNRNKEGKDEVVSARLVTSNSSEIPLLIELPLRYRSSAIEDVGLGDKPPPTIWHEVAAASRDIDAGEYNLLVELKGRGRVLELPITVTRTTWVILDWTGESLRLVSCGQKEDRPMNLPILAKENMGD